MRRTRLSRPQSFQKYALSTTVGEWIRRTKRSLSEFPVLPNTNSLDTDTESRIGHLAFAALLRAESIWAVEWTKMIESRHKSNTLHVYVFNFSSCSFNTSKPYKDGKHGYSIRLFLFFHAGCETKRFHLKDKIMRKHLAKKTTEIIINNYICSFLSAGSDAQIRPSYTLEREILEFSTTRAAWRAWDLRNLLNNSRKNRRLSRVRRRPIYTGQELQLHRFCP